MVVDFSSTKAGAERKAAGVRKRTGKRVSVRLGSKSWLKVNPRMKYIVSVAD